MNFVQNLAIRFERFVELVYAKRVSRIKLVTRLARFWTKSILVGGQLNAPAHVHTWASSSASLRWKIRSLVMNFWLFRWVETGESPLSPVSTDEDFQLEQVHAKPTSA